MLLLIEGVCEIYGRPYSYGAEWVTRSKENGYIHEIIPWRPPHKVSDDIALILGVRQGDPFECNIWEQLLARCAVRARLLCDRPEWGELVDAEISAH